MLATTRGASARNRNFDSRKSRDASHTAALKKLAQIARKAELPAERGGLPPKIERFLATATIPSPCMVVDVDLVEHF